jgi:hypothetical protein
MDGDGTSGRNSVVAAADFGAYILWLGTSVTENCDNGTSRWDCNEFLGGVSPLLFVAFFLVLVALVGVGLVRLGKQSASARSTRK